MSNTKREHHAKRCKVSLSKPLDMHRGRSPSTQLCECSHTDRDGTMPMFMQETVKCLSWIRAVGNAFVSTKQPAECPRHGDWASDVVVAWDGKPSLASSLPGPARVQTRRRRSAMAPTISCMTSAAVGSGMDVAAADADWPEPKLLTRRAASLRTSTVPSALRSPWA